MLAEEERIADADAALTRETLEIERAERAEERDASQSTIETLQLDPLTGLLNRGKFNAELDALLERIGREEHRRDTPVLERVSLLIIDLDNFKAANDTFGHAKGDEVLKLAAQTISGAVRHGVDIVGRPGGDEFSVALPGATADEALAVANKICAALRAEPRLHEHIDVGDVIGDVNITASIGVCCSDKTKGREQLTVCADTAMYDSKELGRNQATLYSGPAPA